DIDQIYMNALHLLGEQGGWPLTMFLTPKAEPVWGGTYFPKETRFGRPAFVDVLREVARLFREEPGRIEQNRAALLARLSDRARPTGRVTIGLKELDAAAMQLDNMFDQRNGGLRGAPKFPQPAILEMLWRAGERTDDQHFFDTVEFSLQRMSEGGIYDHLGGGFSRYSVDEKWLVPHFEKMLYDNAQLLELLALAWQRSGTPLFAQRARETVAWLEREMTTGEGAFAASLDADSEGEEGKFYVWSHDEIVKALGAQDGDYFARHYDVTPGGNFEGHNILNRLENHPRNAEDESRLTRLRAKLLAIRDKRARPGLDDKALADWNGLMIAALVNAGLILDEPSWLEMARRAFAFVAKQMSVNDRLGHSWRSGKLLFPGLASDFAAMIRAGLALFEATGDAAYLDRSLAWQSAFDAHYVDADTGIYYLSADDTGDLLLRPQSTQDDATPNPNAVAAQNLVRLAILAGDDKWRAKADRLIETILAGADQNLLGHIALLNALDLRLRAAEIVVAGSGASHFAAAALKLPYLDRIVLRVPDVGALPSAHPVQAKLGAAAEATAFVCVGEMCSLPIRDAGHIAAVVAQMSKPYRASDRS
ncbi:MAG TPA: thioredoxin domain-containing protein, partial [Pseudolabrys sp.]|nr:thioredoxin domain-containing protein [Pseudolabrys sp.]